MIVPKLKQRKDGNWTVRATDTKKWINLQTKVYSEARERAKEATYEGKRDFSTDRFYQATNATPAATGAPAGDWQTDVADAVQSGIKPDTYFNPNGEGMRLLPEVSSDSGPPPPTDAPHTPTPEGSTEIPSEMFDSMMAQAADILVEAQIKGQEWLIARALKANAGPVPMSNVGRTSAAKFWNQQLAKWMPRDVPLPEWAAAMIACAMFTIPAQLSGATPIVPEATTPVNPDYKTD